MESSRQAQFSHAIKVKYNNHLHGQISQNDQQKNPNRLPTRVMIRLDFCMVRYQYSRNYRKTVVGSIKAVGSK